MTVLQDRLDYIEAQIGDLATLIKGNAATRDEGLNGDVQQIQRDVNLLMRAMLPDHLGHGGFQQRIEKIEGALGFTQKKAELHWKFWTAVAVAAISTAGLLLSEWPKLREYWQKPGTGKLEQMVDDAKHPKGRHLRFKVKAEDLIGPND